MIHLPFAALTYSELATSEQRANVSPSILKHLIALESCLQSEDESTSGLYWVEVVGVGFLTLQQSTK